MKQEASVQENNLLQNRFEAWELEAYAEGVAMPDVAQVVAQHPEAWATWLQQMQQNAIPYSILARFDCPTPEQLRNYCLSELPQAEEKRVAAHLATCTTCSEELQSLVDFLDAGLDQAFSPSPIKPVRSLPSFNLQEQIDGWVDRARTIVANLIPPLLPTVTPVALRSDEPLPTLSAERPATLLFEAEETDISLVAMKETDGQLVLFGQVLASDKVDGGKVKLTPEASQQEILTTTMDEAGAFVVNQLQPGCYHLNIALGDRAIVIPNVMLQ